MTKGAPGFRKLKDKFITSVNNRACNIVTLKTADGKVFEIEAQYLPYGIAGLSMREIKKEKKTNA